MRTLYLLLCLCVLYVIGGEGGEGGGEGGDNMNGMVYTCGVTGGYSSPSSDMSMTDLSATHGNWVSVVWTWYQPTISDTTIAPLPNVSPSEADIIHFVSTARRLGLKVAFKPHVDLSNDGGHWRGDIGNNFNQQAQWNAWFASYQAFLNYVAGVASKLDADLLVIGTELGGTEAQVALWRSTIQGIKKNFGGPLVYGANWYPFNLTWWDAVDYIGVDAYFPLTNQVNPPVATLVSGWGGPLAIIDKTAKQYNKKVIFTEIGYESKANTAMTPYGSTGPLNLQAQANCYQAFFTAVYPQAWFQGVFWWAWGIDPNEGGKCDSGYSPHNKPTEAILDKYYGSGAEDEVMNAPYVIFKDGSLSPGWQDWSYSGKVSFQSTQVVYPGETYSLQANLNGWGAVSLRSVNVFNTMGYTSLTFLIAGSSSLSNSVFVSLFDQNDQSIYNLNLANYYSNCTVEAAWQTITVPLSVLLLPSSSSSSLIHRVQFLNWQPSPGLFYLDEIYLV